MNQQNQFDNHNNHGLEILNEVDSFIAHFTDFRSALQSLDYDQLGPLDFTALFEHAVTVSDGLAALLKAHVLHMMMCLEANILREITIAEDLTDDEKHALFARKDFFVLMAVRGKVVARRKETAGDETTNHVVISIFDVAFFVSRSVNGRSEQVTKVATLEEAMSLGGFSG